MKWTLIYGRPRIGSYISLCGRFKKQGDANIDPRYFKLLVSGIPQKWNP